MATRRKKRSKKTAKRGRTSKGKIPLAILENRYESLGRVIKRRGSKLSCD